MGCVKRMIGDRADIFKNIIISVKRGAGARQYKVNNFLEADMKKLWFLAVVLVLAGCAGRGGNTVSETAGLTIMTWNVHNLFDGEDNGDEYGEFLQSAGWSKEKYMGRINSITAAIGKIEPGPDIIVFQEIESLNVLEDLAISMARGYSWGHFANNPGSAIGLGILSRLPMPEAAAHSITIGGETSPRPVLEARVQTEYGEFVVFACHWKSKIGGDDVTERVRRACARVILRRIRELWNDEPGLGVIVAGDLNENHDEFFRRNGGSICALLPDDPYCARLAGFTGADSGRNSGLQKDFIVVSGNKPPSPAHFPDEVLALFSPWMDGIENGSYFYKNNWETIDHFLISGQFFDNSGWEYETAFTANFEPFTGGSGTPVSYNLRTGSGLSDHLPLLLRLKISVSGDEAISLRQR
jgi:endonuclease/exonuclease/phosphatase family metal-dependent hydrolase